MTNLFENLGPDDRPTAPYRTTGDGGARRDGWRRCRWTAALAVTAVVAGGGSFAAAGAAAGSPAAPATQGGATTASASTATSTAAQESVLNNVLRGHAGPARLRRLDGMYGQFTFETKNGARTVAFERGTVTSVSGGDVVVRARNGTTWSWTLTGDSVVREAGRQAKASALAPGQLVLTGGPVSGGTRDVRLIVIRKAAPAGTA